MLQAVLHQIEMLSGRLEVHHTDFSRVRLAYMERNGAISVIPDEAEPQIIKVGVETVRIELAR